MLYRVFLALLLYGTCTAAALAQHSMKVLILIPAGTQIRMYVPGEATSQRAQAGDTFTAKCSVDVVVDDAIVVRKDADGQGTIVAVKHAAGVPVDALALKFDWVYAVDGTKIVLSQAGNANPSDRRGAESAGTPYLTSFGLGGFFGFVLASAKDDVSVQAQVSGAK